MDQTEFQNMMIKAPKWLDEFIENKQNMTFLKERVNMPSWIHLSPARLDILLNQVDKITSKNGSTKKVWPNFANRFKGTDRADSIYAIIEYGLREPDAFEKVICLIVYLISIPAIRIYLEPLLEETLFMVRCSDHRLVDLLEHHLSFQCTISEGTLPWDQVKKLYNEKLIKFQSCIYQSLADEEKLSESSINPLVSATISQLNDPYFLHRHLSELDPKIFERLKQEFGVNPTCAEPEESKNLTITGLTRILASPINPLTQIPKFLMPLKLPPKDIVFPHFDQHALCLSDAILQVFQEKRIEMTYKVLHFLETVKKAVDINNEERYNKHAVPLVVSPALTSFQGYPTNTCFSVMFDAQYLHYDFTAPEENDIVYLLNNETGVFCPFLVVKKTGESSFIAHLECQNLPDGDFQICVKLPKHLQYEVNRAINLPKILLNSQINQPLIDSFIGFATKGDPAITVVETPLGGSAPSDAAKWLADDYFANPKKKTVVFAISQKEIDVFVTKLFKCRDDVKIPQMYLLRLDLPKDTCVESMLKSRKKMLETANCWDRDIGNSCATAINSLKLSTEEPLQELVGYLEALRPLEFIASTQKRIDYLKRSSKIICHLIGEPLQLKGLKVDNCIVLDSCQIEDSDLLSIFDAINPTNLRLYGNGKAFQRLNRMAQSDLSIVKKEFVTEYDIKTKDILEFLDSEGFERLTPAVLSTFHIWDCQHISTTLEAAVASALLFELLGYRSIQIVADEKYIERLDLIVRERTAWNAKLTIADSLCETNRVIQKNQTSEVIVYVEIGAPEDTRIADIAHSASHIMWSCVCRNDEVLSDIRDEERRENPEMDNSELQFLKENNVRIASNREKYVELAKKYKQTPAMLVLDEKYGMAMKQFRNVFAVLDVQHLFGLVYSMQLDICHPPL